MKLIFTLLLTYSMQYSISALADSNETIRVQGMGELKIMPEVASINYDITTKNKDSKKAQETNNVEAIRIDKLLKSEHKIEEKDLATQGYQVNPDYDWTDNKRVFKGFTVVHHRSILIRNIKDAGKILDELYSTSNTEQKTINIHGIYYFTLKKQQYERECIQLAMDDAEGKAEIMAKKAKRGIKKVLRISDSTQQWQQPTPTPMMYSKSASMSTMSMSERSADTSVPVSSGEMSFTTTVHVEFEMQ